MEGSEESMTSFLDEGEQLYTFFKHFTYLLCVFVDLLLVYNQQKYFTFQGWESSLHNHQILGFFSLKLWEVYTDESFKCDQDAV